MSKFITIAVLMGLVAVCIAQDYITIAIQIDLPEPERVLGRLELMRYFDDTAEISFNSMPLYYKGSTNNLWKIVNFPKREGKTAADITAWVSTNFPAAETNKIDAFESNRPASTDIKTRGYEPVAADIPLGE